MHCLPHLRSHAYGTDLLEDFTLDPDRDIVYSGCHTTDAHDTVYITLLFVSLRCCASRFSRYTCFEVGVFTDMSNHEAYR